MHTSVYMQIYAAVDLGGTYLVLVSLKNYAFLFCILENEQSDFDDEFDDWEGDEDLGEPDFSDDSVSSSSAPSNKVLNAVAIYSFKVDYAKGISCSCILKLAALSLVSSDFLSKLRLCLRIMFMIVLA